MAKTKKVLKKIKSAVKKSKTTKQSKKIGKAALKKSVSKSSKKFAPRKVKPDLKLKSTSTKVSKTKPNLKKISKTSSVANTKTADFSQFLTPLDDRILVRLQKGERKTAGGLFIPETSSDVSGNFIATVVAVGRGHLDKKGRVRPLDVATGDKIIFSEHAGSRVQLMGEDLYFLREADVLGVIQ